MTQRILVTGATGKQGGAVARALLAKGHQVRGLTRNLATAAAQDLRAQGVEMVTGNFNDQASLEQAAQDVDSIFIVGTPFEAGPAAEVRQGMVAIDAAVKAGVKHILYTSVASANKGTGVPHFESKYRVEQHLQQQNVPFTIIAPVYFMENLFSPENLQSIREGVFVMGLPADRRLQQISVENVGAFGAMVLDRPEEFAGQRIDIASDELSNTQLLERLSAALGREIGYMELTLNQVRSFSEDFAMMLQWFDEVGYSANIAGLRRHYPEVGWHYFDEWLAKQDLRKLQP